MKKSIGRDTCWLGILLVLALALFCSNLGELPLRDWDEATAAQVAREIWQAPPGTQRWLFPTLWAEPYFNKPPLIHNAMALAYQLLGETERAARLPGALCSAVSVLGLYGVACELFPKRRTAFLSAALYLTLLPVARHGRLAMLDGALLCFALLACWSLLRARRDLRWSAIAGLAWSLLCLTKGVALGGLFGGIALAFLLWDTPRLLGNPYWWGGIFLGSAPAWGWYAAQWWHYAGGFARIAVVDQGLSRLWKAVERNGGPPWYYTDKLLQALPALPIFGFGLRLAWQQRCWSWAKLAICWGGIYFACISLAGTKLPWYLLPVYPPLAIAGGAALEAVLEFPADRPYPRWWGIAFGAMGIISAGSGAYFGILAPEPDTWLALACSGLALTGITTTVLLLRRDALFVAVLLWGTWVALWLFFQSTSWNWELNEAYPVRPVARAVGRALARKPEAQVYTSFAYERPSLNYYSRRRIPSKSAEEIQAIWQQAGEDYFLIEADALGELQISPTSQLKLPGNWLLVPAP